MGSEERNQSPKKTDKLKKESTKRRHQQLRYLSQAAVLEESHSPYRIRHTMLTVCFGVLLFIIWAAVTETREIARAAGSVIPTGYVQTVQHLEGGIVQAIHVTDGDFVEKDTALITLSGEQVTADLERMKARYKALEQRGSRLRAFVQALADQGEDQQPSSLAPEDEEILQSMVASRESRRQVLKEQIKQKENEIRGLRSRRSTLQQNLALATENRDTRKTLLDKGLSSKTAYFDAQKEVNRLQGELNGLKSELEKARNAIREFEGRIASLDAGLKDDALQELDQVETERAELKELITKAEAQASRLEIRAPSDGIVKGLTINTIGAVISAGQTLLEIVPINQTLDVELRLSPHDIGHIAVGQPVDVKISAYDFSRYGSIDGTLASISATTFVTEDGNSYYKGKVTLSQSYVGNDPKRNIILPGMVVQGDIQTGTKTVLEYLLRPIHQAISSSLTER